MDKTTKNIICEYFHSHNYCYSMLLEAKHIVTTFNDVADYIVSNIKNYQSNKLIYTGWNFYRDEDICKNVKDESIAIPIYIIIEYLGHSTFAYIDKRNFEDEKIILHINHLNINDDDLLSKIHHEFVHAKNSFSNKAIDPLMNYQHQYDIENILYYIDIENKKYSLENKEGYDQYELFNISYFNRAYNALYLISKTEQEARINQIYKYITKKYNNSNVPSKEMLFKEVLHISLLDTFNELVSQCGEWQDNKYCYKLVLCVAYYMNKIGYLSYKGLTDENMVKYFNIIDGNVQNMDIYFNVCVSKCYNLLYNSLMKYEQMVVSIISDATFDIKEGKAK